MECQSRLFFELAPIGFHTYCVVNSNSQFLTAEQSLDIIRKLFFIRIGMLSSFEKPVLKVILVNRD
jgi:hypothetical protein